MNYTKNRFYRKLSAAGVTGSIVTMRDYPVFEDNIAVYTHVVVINSDSGNSDFLVGVRRPLYSHPYHEFVDVTAGVHYSYDRLPIVLYPYDRLEVRVSGSTDGDSLGVYCSGFMTYKDDNSL